MVLSDKTVIKTFCVSNIAFLTVNTPNIYPQHNFSPSTCHIQIQCTLVLISLNLARFSASASFGVVSSSVCVFVCAARWVAVVLLHGRATAKFRLKMRQKGVPARLEQDGSTKPVQVEGAQGDSHGQASCFGASETVAMTTEAASSHASTDGDDSSRPETMGDVDGGPQDSMVVESELDDEPWYDVEDEEAVTQTCSPRDTEENIDFSCSVDNCGDVFNNGPESDQHTSQHDSNSETQDQGDLVLEDIGEADVDGVTVDESLVEDSHCSPNIEESKEFPVAEATNVKYYCNQPECGYKTFKSRTGWTLHMREHKSDYRFRCEHCDFGCFTERRLKEHTACKHTGTPVCFCSICKKGFVTFTGLRHHESLHKNELYPCDYCDKVYKNKKDKEKHKRTHQLSFACKLCLATFVWKHHAVTHLKMVHKMLTEEVRSDWDKCMEEVTKEVPDIVRKPSSSKGESQAVERSKVNRQGNARRDKKASKTVEKDGKVVEEKGRKSLRLQRKLASSKKSNVTTCELGDNKKIQTDDALCNVNTLDGIHLDAATPSVLDIESQLKKETRYECTVQGCGKTFKAKKVYKLHMKAHNECNDATMQQIENMDKDGQDNENKIACPVEGCGKKFKNKKVFKLHMQGHNDNYPFRCEICNFGCFQQRKLREHTASVHIGIPVCFCPICGKEFLSYSGLNRHKYTHRDEVYKCDVCEKEYKNAKERDRHRRSHEQRYVCPICEKRFGMKHHLKSHYRYMHTEATPNIYPSYMYSNTEIEELPTTTILDGGVEKPKRLRARKTEDDNDFVRQSSTWSNEYPSMISVEGKTHFPAMEEVEDHSSEELEPEVQAAIDNFSEEGDQKRQKTISGKERLLDPGKYIPSEGRKGIFMDIFKLMGGSKLGVQKGLEGERLTQEDGNDEQMLLRQYHLSRDNASQARSQKIAPMNLTVGNTSAISINLSEAGPSASLSRKKLSNQTKLVLSGTTSCDVCGKKFLSSAGLQRHKLLHLDQKTSTNVGRVGGGRTEDNDI
ncbi:zinc finger protein 569-like isoform X2 [Branchiostoma lanceolatum]|uniref:zinc finger protein 569-like isoform X2 n=1 Tax=Branchiostoma lanceolatum TaxID=7740 RepID=UPI003455B336